MIKREQIVLVCGLGERRSLTDEEWVQVNQLIMDGKIVIQSYQDSMEEKLNEILKDELIKIDKMEYLFKEEEKQSNQHWKKSNQRNHPAFRRKKR